MTGYEREAARISGQMRADGLLPDRRRGSGEWIKDTLASAGRPDVGAWGSKPETAFDRFLDGWMGTILLASLLVAVLLAVGGAS